MGRKARMSVNVRAMLAERDAALETMNFVLQQKRAKIVSQLGDARSGNVRFNHALGMELLDVERNPEGIYGSDRPLQLLMASLPQDNRFLRKLKQFASLISPAELEELMAIKNEDADWVMHWGHFQFLLTLNTHNIRLSFANRAARGLWDPAALRDAILARYGHSTGTPHGRTHTMPATVHMQIKQIHQKTTEWVRKATQVWDGPEQSVITNVLNEPPDDLETMDLTRLVELDTLLTEQITTARALKTRINEAKQYVERVLRERAQHSQTDQELVATTGRHARHINVSDEGRTSRRRTASVT